MKLKALSHVSEEPDIKNRMLVSGTFSFKKSGVTLSAYFPLKIMTPFNANQKFWFNVLTTPDTQKVRSLVPTYILFFLRTGWFVPSALQRGL